VEWHVTCQTPRQSHPENCQRLPEDCNRHSRTVSRWGTRFSI
jgi:hypothetical protein